MYIYIYICIYVPSSVLPFYVYMSIYAYIYIYIYIWLQVPSVQWFCELDKMAKQSVHTDSVRCECVICKEVRSCIRNISRSPLWSSWCISSLISYTSNMEYKQKSSVELLVYFLTDFMYL